VGKSLGGGGKVDDVLHLRHHRHLIEPVWEVHALALGAHVVAVEVRGPLLELGKVLNRPQRPLRAVNLLVEQAAQAHRVEPKPRRLRPHIWRLVESRVGMEV
jgi:hypothetical protein